MDPFFSDSDEDKAVEDLLSQAMDLTTLDQVAKINCASFSHSDLPSHLETRFQKLKSFPNSTPKHASLSSSKSLNLPKIDPVNGANDRGGKNGEKGFCLSPSISSESGDFSPLKKNPKSKLGENGAEEKNGEKGFCLSPSISSENGDFSPLKKNPKSKLGKNGAEEKNGEKGFSQKSGNFSPLKKNPQKKLGKKEIKSPFSSSSSWEGLDSSRSISPPAKSGCFLCSPKRVSRKKSKENRGFDLGLDWGKNDEFLSDFSINSHKKMIKKAMEEEEKLCREADKIVKWAKHASARMEVSDIDDEISDDENTKF